MKLNLILVSFFLIFTVELLSAANKDFYLFHDIKVSLIRDHSKVYIELPGGLKSRPTLSQTLSRIPKHDRPDANRFLFQSNKLDAETRAKSSGLPANTKLYPVYVDPLTGRNVFIFNEIIVRIQSATDRQQILNWLSARKLELLRRDPFDKKIWLLKSVNPTGDILSHANDLNSKKEFFVWAEPNLYPDMQKNFLPDDPLFEDQWHLKNTGQQNGTPGADMDAELAWDLTQGDPTIVIALLDDGLDMDHEDIAPNLFTNTAEIVDGIDNDNNGFIDDVSGWDFCDDDNNPRHILFNTERHGTATAGIAAARGNNALGVSGVAPQSRLFSCKIFKGDDYCGNFEAASAFRFAAQFADVISNSWGGGSASSVIESALIDARVNGRDGRGCVIYFSSGNSFASTVAFPARYPWVIAVGASSREDSREGFSNFGPTLNFVAPTANFTTDRTGRVFGYSPIDTLGNYTAAFSGTSAACPAAAGAGALILARNPNLTADQVLALQQNSAEKINPGAVNYNDYGSSLEYGSGRINAWQALMDTPTTHSAIDDAFEDDDTSVTAKPISNTVVNGLIALDEDWFVARLAPGLELTGRIDFIHALVDLRLELYDSNGTLLVQSDTDQNSEKVQYILPEETDTTATLYLRVASDNYAPHGYRIRVNEREPDDILEQNDEFSEATPLADGEYLALKAFDDDFYRVDVQPGEGVIFEVIFEHSKGDIDLFVFDQDGEKVAVSESADDDERINIAGSADITAFVFQVFGFADATNDYELKLRRRFISEDDLEENDTIDTPIDLANGTYHLSGLNSDWFRVRVDELSPISVRIDFVNEFGDLDLQLFNDRKVLADSSLSANQDFEEVSSFARINNDFFLIHVFALGDEINTYTLTIKDSKPADDIFEENDFAENAVELLAGFEQDLILNDEDFFKASVPPDHALQFKAFFVHGIGDLQLELLDSDFQQVDVSTSSENSEVVQVYNSQATARDYFLRVYGQSNASNPDYSLETLIQQDQFKENDSFAQAHPIVAGIYFNQLLLDEDWYVFDAKVDDNIFAAVSFSVDKGSIEFELYDSTMQLLRQAIVSEAFDFISHTIGETGIYYLRIAGSDNLNFYRLTLQVPNGKTDRWHFAEGSSVSEFNTYLLLANPNNSHAKIRLRYLRRGKGPLEQEMFLAPFSRTTINAKESIPGAWFGTDIQAINGEQIFAERAMYWDVGGVFRAGGSATIASNEAKAEWFLAEGTTTSDRETNILIANPNDTAIQVKVTYLVQNFGPVEVSYGIQASQQILVVAAIDVPNSDFSAVIKSENDVPIIVERTLYFAADNLNRAGGHTSIAATPDSSWFFAEGETGSLTETFYLLANNHPTHIDARITYFTDNDEVIEQDVTIYANQRITVKANNLLTTSSHSVKIESLDGRNFIAERAMYQRSGSVERNIGTVSIGSPELGTEWFFAEGRTGGISSFKETIALGNPTTADAEIEIRFVTHQQQEVLFNLTVPAQSRRTVSVHDIPGLEDVSNSAFVTSTNNIPIVAERTMTWSRPGSTIPIEAHTSIGFGLSDE